MSEGLQEKLRPLVSVIVNNYNKGKYLKRCLDSIYNQTYNNIEIVFWDDNSTDDSVRVFDKWCSERVRRTGRSVRFGTTKQLYPTHVSKFVPLGVTRWLALHMCTGKYIAICDSDDYWMYIKLEMQLSYDRCDDAGLSFTDCFMTNKEGSDIEYYSNKYPPFHTDVYKKLLTKYNFVAASTVIFDREKLMSVIGSPTHYTSGEDYDWVLKVSAKYRVVYYPSALTYYTVSNNSLTHSKRSSTQATWYEIDAVVSSYKREGKYKYFVICHLVKLYAKLIWKQFVREKF